MHPPPGQPIPAGAPKSADDLLNIPSILVLSVAALSAMLWVYNAIAGGGSDPDVAKQLADPNLPPMARTILTWMLGSQRLFAIVMVLINGVAIYGAIQMRQLKMYGLAVTSAFLVMVPLFTCCCCVPGLGGGIWALVLLFKPEVKAAFT